VTADQPHKKGMSDKTIFKPKSDTKIKIALWLQQRKHELIQERPTRDKVIEDIRKELNVVIQPQTLRDIAKAADCDWSPKQSKRGGDYTGPNSTRNTLLLHAKQIFALKQALAVLCNRLGEQPPAELVAGWPHANEPEDDQK
jgi:hypothetical protein